MRERLKPLLAFSIVLFLLVAGMVFATTISDGRSLFAGINASQKVDIRTSETTNSLRITPLVDTGGVTSRDGALFVDNTLNDREAFVIYSNKNPQNQSANLIIFNVANANWSRPILRINCLTCDQGGAADIRIDSQNPDIEMIETDSTTPAGKFEMAVQSDRLQLNGRNKADNSFETMVYFTRRGALSNAGMMGLGKTPVAYIDVEINGTLGASATQNALQFYNTAASAGGCPGINWFNNQTGGTGSSTARLCSSAGSSYTFSNLLFQVANPAKTLVTRAVLGARGHLNVTSFTIGGYNSTMKDMNFTMVKNGAYICAGADSAGDIRWKTGACPNR